MDQRLSGLDPWNVVRVPCFWARVWKWGDGSPLSRLRQMWVVVGPDCFVLWTVVVVLVIQGKESKNVRKLCSERLITDCCCRDGGTCRRCCPEEEVLLLHRSLRSV